MDQTFQNKNIFKDFDLNFSANPLTNDISVKKDVNAINQSLRSLLMTGYYERPFQPWLGSKIKKILFEPADYITIANLRSAINEIIGNYEPRVTLQSINIDDLSQSNSYNINVNYVINSSKDLGSVNIVLERIR